jgi:hypothetical protein
MAQPASTGSSLYRQLQNYMAGNTGYYPLYRPGAVTWFVAPSTYTTVANGVAPSNSNSGETPMDPLASIAQAHTNCVASRGDTICLMPGTFTLTGTLALTKAAISLVALKPYASTIAGDGVITTGVSIDGNDMTLAGLRFTGAVALVTLVDIANTTAVRNTHIHHCKFIGLETVTGVTGILNGELVAGNDAAHTTIEDCEFEGLSAACITTYGGGCRIRNNTFNLDDTAAHTAIIIGDMGAAFATRKCLSIRNNAFIGQTDASALLAMTFAGIEAQTQMWEAWGNSFASCAAPTAAIHPEGAAGPNYVGTTTTTAPTLWPA